MANYNVFYRLEQFLQGFPALLPTLLCVTFVTVMSLIPSSELPGAPIDFADKLVHVLFYFVFGFLLILVLEKRLKHPIILGFLLATGYGIMMEFAQHFLTTGRFFEYKDMVANGIGAFFASLCRRQVKHLALRTKK